MQVYIEYVIIDNLIMDYLLLKLTCALLQVKSCKFNLVLGAVLGAIIASFVPLLRVNRAMEFIIKLILGCAVALVGAKHKSLFGYFKFFNLFVLLTFLMGGAILGIYSLLGVDVADLNLQKPSLLPVGINLLCAYLLYVIIKRISLSVVKKLQHSTYCDVELTAHGSTVKLRAFIDSGNTLIDAKSGLRVIVTTPRVAKVLFGQGEKPFRYMPITTASGFGFIGLYELDEVLVKSSGKARFFSCELGVSNALRDNPDFDVIIGSNLL